LQFSAGKKYFDDFVNAYYNEGCLEVKTLLFVVNSNVLSLNLNDGGFRSMDKDNVNYSEMARSPQFRELMRHKKRFIVPLSVFFFAFYFTLPILTSYTTVLNRTAFGPVSWAWVFAFAQFVMTWVLCVLYSRKASSFDRLAQDVRKQAGR
jgi:uncharacterized membrane protein (DUF485 family)